MLSCQEKDRDIDDDRDDKKNIESLYGNSYLDISDLTLLPKKLLKVIKKYV